MTAITTAEQLEQLPDDDCRYDLIRGVLYQMSPAGGRHGMLAAELARRLGNHVVERRLGRVFGAETGFVLARDPDTVLGPDVAFVATERLPPEEEWDRFPRLAPDLAAEIFSPSERGPSVREKVREYLDAGVRLVWIVDPRRRTVTVYTPDGASRVVTDSEELDGGEVLPGFRLPLAELFS
jgi:Uma2 family endonuclease